LTRIMIGTHLPRKSRIWDRILPYPSTYGEKGPSLQPVLTQVVNELKPKKIGINESATIPICDGLSVQMKKHLVDAIGPVYASRLVSAEPLIVDFLDTRLPEEMPIFVEAAKITEALAADLLSDAAIQPGKTTVDDLRWRARDWLMAMKVQTWFPVGISIRRQGAKGLDESAVIQPGDIVHTDLGIVYSGLYTDYQRSGYVLKPGETEPPPGLRAALANNNKVHELLARVATPGKPGYVVKQEAEAVAKASGLTASIGCHSIDAGGHGIGAWFNADWPDRYSVRATFPVRLGAYTAIEFSTATPIPEWGGEVLRMGVEDSGYASEEGLKYFLPLQQQYYLVRSDTTPR
jgi:Xaa-Pro dipeptidase